MISLSKKSLAGLVLAMTIVMGTASLAAAQQGGDMRDVTGEVVRKTNTRIVVRDNNRDLSVIATLGEIRGKDNQRIGLDQIQVGDTVRVQGTMAGNSLKADTITVQQRA